ncbi:hypothetical protein AX16_005743 [Volvariella volvacea WC 439]|nr:hypothetical protein AX16_005743 [Volvariella volvacea WC 439]
MPIFIRYNLDTLGGRSTRDGQVIELSARNLQTGPLTLVPLDAGIFACYIIFAVVSFAQLYNFFGVLPPRFSFRSSSIPPFTYWALYFGTFCHLVVHAMSAAQVVALDNMSRNPQSLAWTASTSLALEFFIVVKDTAIAIALLLALSHSRQAHKSQSKYSQASVPGGWSTERSRLILDFLLLFAQFTLLVARLVVASTLPFERAALQRGIQHLERMDLAAAVIFVVLSFDILATAISTKLVVSRFSGAHDSIVNAIALAAAPMLVAYAVFAVSMKAHLHAESSRISEWSQYVAIREGGHDSYVDEFIIFMYVPSRSYVHHRSEKTETLKWEQVKMQYNTTGLKELRRRIQEHHKHEDSFPGTQYGFLILATFFNVISLSMSCAKVAIVDRVNPKAQPKQWGRSSDLVHIFFATVTEMLIVIALLGVLKRRRSHHFRRNLWGWFSQRVRKWKGRCEWLLILAYFLLLVLRLGYTGKNSTTTIEEQKKMQNLDRISYAATATLSILAIDVWTTAVALILEHPERKQDPFYIIIGFGAGPFLAAFASYRVVIAIDPGLEGARMLQGKRYEVFKACDAFIPTLLLIGVVCSMGLSKVCEWQRREDNTRA